MPWQPLCASLRKGEQYCTCTVYLLLTASAIVLLRVLMGFPKFAAYKLCKVNTLPYSAAGCVGKFLAFDTAEVHMSFHACLPNWLQGLTSSAMWQSPLLHVYMHGADVGLSLLKHSCCMSFGIT